jgi:transglutaminase-like putative cysteine protease
MTSTRRLRVGCEFQHWSQVQTPAVFQVEPKQGGLAVVVGREWTSAPEAASHPYVDVYGNTCRRITLPAGFSTVRYDALVTVPDVTEAVDLDAPETSVADLPDSALLFTMPSRYVSSDVMGDEAWELFGALKPGYRRVQAICDFVHSALRFAHGSSTALTTAAQVRAAGVGVCRDYTHLAITYARALNIPARYVFGYLPDIDIEPADVPMDFAAWMEVYLDGSWWTFDPRNNVPLKGRVLIGRGRDALDVAMVTTYGRPRLDRMDVWADEIEVPAMR